MTTHQPREPVILYVATVDWWFVLHRMHIALAARDAGFRVVVATSEADHGDELRRAGIEVLPVEIHRTSVGPVRAVQDVAALARIYRRQRPDIVHHLAIRPSVLGSVAAAMSGTRPVVNNLAGLGSVFVDPAPLRTRVLRRAILTAFRLTFNRPHSSTVVENADDLSQLRDSAKVRSDRLALIPSAGVDLDQFPPAPPTSGVPVVTMAARMLATKGVADFVAAARILAGRAVPVRMRLVGMPDPAHPHTIDERQLRRWDEEGCVEWLGWRSDMRRVWAECSIAVLPSYYREGVPVSLLEAAASTRPIVATDVPGCRDVVANGLNGVLVPPRRPGDLAAAIESLLADAARREAMGRAGRRIVEERYSTARVQALTLDLYRRLLDRAGSP